MILLACANIKDTKTYSEVKFILHENYSSEKIPLSFKVFERPL